MYFEIHLTTDSFPADRIEDFGKACAGAQLKFSHLEILKGELRIVPMATFVSFDSYPDLLERVLRLNSYFMAKGFPVFQSRIEIPFEFR
jgi:hypothetical protein